MSIEGQGHFLTIYFPGFVCFVLYKATISGERLQDHWSSGLWGYSPVGVGPGRKPQIQVFLSHVLKEQVCKWETRLIIE